MDYRELIDKRVVAVASVLMLLMLTMLLVIYPQKQSNNLNSSANKSDNAKEVVYAFSTQSVSLSTEESGVDVLLTAPVNSKVSAATIRVKYPSNLVSFNEGNSQPSTACEQKNNKLDTLFALKNSSVSDTVGMVEITRTALVEDDMLPSGEFCFGTLYFSKTAEANLSTASLKSISFEPLETEVNIVGPNKVKYVATVDSVKGKISIEQ